MLTTNRKVDIFEIMKRKGLEKQFREAIQKSGYTQNHLSKLAGVDRAQINRFIKGQRSLTLKSAEKIARVLNIEFKTIEQDKGSK